MCVCVHVYMSESEKETLEYINSRPCLKCLVMINVSFQFLSQAYVFLQQMNFLEQSWPERMQLFWAPRTSGKLLWRTGSSPLTKQMFSTVAGKQDFFFRCVFYIVHIHFRKYCIPLKGSRAHGALGDSANGHLGVWLSMFSNNLFHTARENKTSLGCLCKLSAEMLELDWK